MSKETKVIRTEYGYCPICNGKGTLPSYLNTSNIYETCYHCNGTKSIISATETLSEPIPSPLNREVKEERIEVEVFGASWVIDKPEKIIADFSTPITTDKLPAIKILLEKFLNGEYRIHIDGTWSVHSENQITFTEKDKSDSSVVEDKGFVWTDNLIKEFGNLCNHEGWHKFSGKKNVETLFNNFKEANSQQPEPTKGNNKEWEILSFKEYYSGEPEKTTNYLYPVCDGKIGPFNNAMLVSDWLKTQPPIYRIHSVLRKEDGEIFKIGDKVHSDKYPVDIESFDCRNPKMAVNLKQGGFIWLEQINRTRNGEVYPKPTATTTSDILFKTEDGKDIRIGEEYYFVSQNFTLDCYTANKWSFADKKSKRFSTKEAAEQYIVRYKPVLCLDDCIIGLPGGFI